jgi:putative ABC transport system permease protein
MLAVNVRTFDDLGLAIRTIDDHFHNWPDETRTQTEKDAIASTLARVVDFNALATGLSAIIFGIVLLVVGNSLVLSSRERLHEIGIMRALGFGPSSVAILIAGEAAILGIVGGVLGSGAALCLFDKGLDLSQFSVVLGHIAVTGWTALYSIGVTTTLTLVSSLLPTVVAVRSRPTETLRSTD